MKKRAFVRYSKQGKIVPGSLILTAGSYPQGSSTWNEVPADLCCLPKQDYSSCFSIQVVPEETDPGVFEITFVLQPKNSGPNMKGTIYWAAGEEEYFNVPSDNQSYNFTRLYSDATVRTIYICIDNPSQLQDLEFGTDTMRGTIVSVNNAYRLNGLDEWDMSEQPFLSLDASGLTSLRQLFIDNTTVLSHVNITGCINLDNVDLVGNALTEASVDHILITLDNNGLSNGIVGLDGGTSAIPSVAGAAAATSLSGKGWSVFVNS